MGTPWILTGCFAHWLSSSSLAAEISLRCCAREAPPRKTAQHRTDVGVLSLPPPPPEFYCFHIADDGHANPRTERGFVFREGGRTKPSVCGARINAREVSRPQLCHCPLAMKSLNEKKLRNLFCRFYSRRQHRCWTFSGVICFWFCCVQLTCLPRSFRVLGASEQAATV